MARDYRSPRASKFQLFTRDTAWSLYVQTRAAVGEVTLFIREKDPERAEWWITTAPGRHTKIGETDAKTAKDRARHPFN